MHNLFRNAALNLQEILKNPGVWDPFILSYVEVSTDSDVLKCKEAASLWKYWLFLLAHLFCSYIFIVKAITKIFFVPKIVHFYLVQLLWFTKIIVSINKCVPIFQKMLGVFIGILHFKPTHSSAPVESEERIWEFWIFLINENKKSKYAPIMVMGIMPTLFKCISISID